MTHVATFFYKRK